METDHPVPKLLRQAALIVGVLALGAGTALADDGNLPGGTAISVTITAPSDGAIKVSPPGVAQLQGTASVGTGVPVANTAIVYVLDVSFSTIRGDGGAGCGGDPNGDGNVDTILDCEIAAAKALNSIAAGLGTVGDVGVAVFGEGGAVGDVGPAGGDQTLTGPATDANSSGGPDVEQVLNSAFSDDSPTDAGLTVFSFKNAGSDGTNFAAGLSAAVTAISASSKPNRIIVYMSDGLANVGAKVDTVAVPSDVTIFTFAIGTISNCTSGALPGGRGSLQDIADMGSGNGTCTQVTDITTLPDVVPGIVASKLLSVKLSVDGGAPTDIPTVPPIPAPPTGLTGPVSVVFDTPVPLAPGVHSLCVTATGSDGGGTGSVQDCITVTVVTISLAPANDTNELTPGATHTVTATVAAGAAGGVGGLTVDFDVTGGPNAGAMGSGVTNASGQATFTYPAQQGPAGLGTDTIEACFGPDEQGDTICDTAQKTWQDTTPPEVSCIESVNPHGQRIPPAGSTTLPGPKGGRNEDGFYKLTAVDLVDPDPEIFVQGTSGTPSPPFGPFPSGIVVKITEAPGATPSIKPMGSGSGQAGAVAWHITLDSDAVVTAVDDSGNTASVTCLVPPPPK